MFNYQQQVYTKVNKSRKNLNKTCYIFLGVVRCSHLGELGTQVLECIFIYLYVFFSLVYLNYMIFIYSTIYSKSALRAFW